MSYKGKVVIYPEFSKGIAYRFMVLYTHKHVVADLSIREGR